MELPTFREMERRIILLRLHQFKGNRTQTARSLGIGIRTLQRKLKIYQANGEAKI